MNRRRDTVILDRRFVPANSMVIQEGDFGAQAFLIQSGQVRVFTSCDGKDVELATLGVGQIVGEMALIFDGPRTASVQATQDCNLIVISRQQFSDKLDNTDPTIKAIVTMLTKRIIDVNNSLINKKGDIDALKEAARVIYQNIYLALPRHQQRTFQKAVLPILDDLIEALEGFQDRYELGGSSDDS